MQVDKDLAINKAGASHLNSATGTINIAQDHTLTFSGTDYSTLNQGAITLGDGGKLLVSGTDARFIHAGGTFTGSSTSTLEVIGSGTRFSILGGGFNHTGDLTIDGTTVDAVFDAGLTPYTNQQTLTMVDAN